MKALQGVLKRFEECHEAVSCMVLPLKKQLLLSTGKASSSRSWMRLRV